MDSDFDELDGIQGEKHLADNRWTATGNIKHKSSQFVRRDFLNPVEEIGEYLIWIPKHLCASLCQ